jgi:hypothetical protein
VNVHRATLVCASLPPYCIARVLPIARYIPIMQRRMFKSKAKLDKQLPHILVSALQPGAFNTV